MKTYNELMEEIEGLQEGVYDRGIFKAFFLAGGPGCFSPETPVWTAEGYKRIDEVKVGDLVKTLDESNQVIERPVTEVFSNAIHGITEVIMDDDTKVICSVDHRFRLSDGTWKEASQLQEGDELWTE